MSTVTVVRLTSDSSGTGADYHLTVRRWGDSPAPRLSAPPHTDLPPDVLVALRAWVNGDQS